MNKNLHKEKIPASRQTGNAILCRHWSENDQTRSIRRLCQWIGKTDGVLLQSRPFPLRIKAVLAERGL